MTKRGGYSVGSQRGGMPQVASFPIPMSCLPSDTCVHTYLCLSLMSAALHTEPYRVSCHCRRVPAGSVSSPRQQVRWSLSHALCWPCKQQRPCLPDSQRDQTTRSAAGAVYVPLSLGSDSLLHRPHSRVERERWHSKAQKFCLYLFHTFGFQQGFC